MPITKGSLVKLPAFTLSGEDKDWRGVPIRATDSAAIPICWTKAGLEAQTDFTTFTIHFSPDSYNGVAGSILKVPRVVICGGDPALALAIADRLSQSYAIKAQELGIIVASCLAGSFLLDAFLHRSGDPLDMPDPEEFDGGEMIFFQATGIPQTSITSGVFNYTLVEDDECAATSNSNDLSLTDFLQTYSADPSQVSDNVDLYTAAAARFSKLEVWNYSIQSPPQVDATVVTHIVTCFGDPVSEETTVYKTAQTFVNEYNQARQADDAAINALGLPGLSSYGELGGTADEPDYEPLIQKVIAFFGL